MSITGEENFVFFARAGKGKWCPERMESCLRQVCLWDDRHRPVSDFSKGILQRLGLALMFYEDTPIE